jgi:hypothetical protein
MAILTNMTKEIRRDTHNPRRTSIRQGQDNAPNQPKSVITPPGVIEYAICKF